MHASASTGFNSSANLRIGRNAIIYGAVFSAVVPAVEICTDTVHAIKRALHCVCMIPPCLIPHLVTSSESRNKGVQNRPEQIHRFHFLFIYWLILATRSAPHCCLCPPGHQFTANSWGSCHPVRSYCFLPGPGRSAGAIHAASLPIRKPSILRRGIPLKRWRLRYGHQFPFQAATANHNQSIKAIYYCMLFGPDTPISPVNSACSTPFTPEVFQVHLLRFLLLLPAFVPVSGIAPDVILCTGRTQKRPGKSLPDLLKMRSTCLPSTLLIWLRVLRPVQPFLLPLLRLSLPSSLPSWSCLRLSLPFRPV